MITEVLSALIFGHTREPSSAIVAFNSTSAASFPSTFGSKKAPPRLSLGPQPASPDWIVPLLLMAPLSDQCL
jgi:hypothetical protein